MLNLFPVLKLTFQTAWKSQPFKTFLLCLLLFGLVLWVFLPAQRGNFIELDDYIYVTGNPHMDFTAGNLVWPMVPTHIECANWHPLTHWSLMLDHRFYGLNPWGYHLTNVLLHAINTVLVFLVLRRMTGATWRSLMVAGLFGLHPLRVESVAWISERKDVLSGLFFMLAIGAYVRYVQKKSRVEGRESSTQASRALDPLARRSRAETARLWTLDYYLVLLFFALGLMSKPMVVTLPCVLLLLDFWPLERWKQNDWRGLLVDKLPFFLLSAIVSFITYVAQRNGGMMKYLTGLSFGARLENALVSYGRYLGKLFWPVDLCAFYPYPGHWPLAAVLASGLLVFGLSGLVFALRRKQPFLLTGWFWFLGTLVPVIGLVQAGAQSMADRYSYIPSVGILIILVWGMCQATRGWHYQSIGIGAIGGVLALFCIVLTRHQIGYWGDGNRVWSRAIAVTENNYGAHNCLGRTWFSQGRLDEAIREFQEVIRLNPNFAEAYISLGRSFTDSKRVDEAIVCYQKVLEIQPDYFMAHFNLSEILSQNGRVDEAIVHYQKALQINPDYEEAHNNLGVTLLRKGNVDEAIVHLQKALEINPNIAEAHCNLGIALFQKRNVDEAIIHLQKALQIKPDYEEACFNLGNALLQKRRVDEAIVCFQKALQIKPDYAEAHNNLGFALNSKGRLDEAIRELQESLRLKPDSAETHCNLGRVLGKEGRLDEAIREFQEALRLKPDYAKASNILVFTLGLKEKQLQPPIRSTKP